MPTRKTTKKEEDEEVGTGPSTREEKGGSRRSPLRRTRSTRTRRRRPPLAFFVGLAFLVGALLLLLLAGRRGPPLQTKAAALAAAAAEAAAGEDEQEQERFRYNYDEDDDYVGVEDEEFEEEDFDDGGDEDGRRRLQQQQQQQRSWGWMGEGEEDGTYGDENKAEDDAETEVAEVAVGADAELTFIEGSLLLAGRGKKRDDGGEGEGDEERERERRNYLDDGNDDYFDDDDYVDVHIDLEEGEDDDDEEEEDRSDRADEGAAADGAADGGIRGTRTNLLFIVCDQLRFDVLQFVQEGLAVYGGKDVVRVRTPNIDRLASRGAVFETAYCASPSCGPARTSLLTGNTLQRTGVFNNRLVQSTYHNRMKLIRERVAQIRTFEQLLVDQRGYQAESYGKWHIPSTKAYSGMIGKKGQRIISYNDYNFETEKPEFMKTMNFKRIYQDRLSYLLKSDDHNDAQVKFRPGYQKNYYSQQCYDPIMLDVRYGMATNTPLDKSAGFEDYEMSNGNIAGKDCLDRRYTRTAIQGQMAARALDRLIEGYTSKGTPFSLSVHFSAPHPPMVAEQSYLAYYWQRRNRLLVPRNIRDRLENTGYYSDTLKYEGKGFKYNDPRRIAELTAVYYGMVEETDAWVGKLLEKLETSGIENQTLVVFTSDHGEMLGAHGRLGKGVLLEEAARVPLIVSQPGQIAPCKVKEPTSHIDMFSTILDYVDAKDLDRSDGRSLRRFIEGTSYNMNYDEGIAVSEVDSRLPVNSNKFSSQLGENPDIMIRHGNFKLVLPKMKNSKVLDMMYDLESDPFEKVNLLGRNGKRASYKVIGKAEHLKVLLIEWMQRMSGPRKYYSDSKYNLGIGLGDISEIRSRRTWRLMEYWQSETGELPFGKPALTSDGYRRNEWLYIGRTKKGTLAIEDISVKGANSSFFKVDKQRAVIRANGYIRIRVSFHSSKAVDLRLLKAFIQIKNDANGVRYIRLAGQTKIRTASPESSAPTPLLNGTTISWPASPPTAPPTTTSPTAEAEISADGEIGALPGPSASPTGKPRSATTEPSNAPTSPSPTLGVPSTSYPSAGPSPTTITPTNTPTSAPSEPFDVKTSPTSYPLAGPSATTATPTVTPTSAPTDTFDVKTSYSPITNQPSTDSPSASPLAAITPAVTPTSAPTEPSNPQTSPSPITNQPSTDSPSAGPFEVPSVSVSDIDSTDDEDSSSVTPPPSPISRERSGRGGNVGTYNPSSIAGNKNRPTPDASVITTIVGGNDAAPTPNKNKLDRNGGSDAVKDDNSDKKRGGRRPDDDEDSARQQRDGEDNGRRRRPRQKRQRTKRKDGDGGEDDNKKDRIDDEKDPDDNSKGRDDDEKDQDDKKKDRDDGKKDRDDKKKDRDDYKKDPDDKRKDRDDKMRKNRDKALPDDHNVFDRFGKRDPEVAEEKKGYLQSLVYVTETDEKRKDDDKEEKASPSSYEDRREGDGGTDPAEAAAPPKKNNKLRGLPTILKLIFGRNR